MLPGVLSAASGERDAAVGEILLEMLPRARNDEVRRRAFGEVVRSPAAAAAASPFAPSVAVVALLADAA